MLLLDSLADLQYSLEIGAVSAGDSVIIPRPILGTLAGDARDALLLGLCEAGAACVELLVDIPHVLVMRTREYARQLVREGVALAIV